MIRPLALLAATVVLAAAAYGLHAQAPQHSEPALTGDVSSQKVDLATKADVAAINKKLDFIICALQMKDTAFCKEPE